MDSLGQLIGGVALLIGISAFLQKDDTKFRYLMAGFCALMAVHFYLLGALVGAVGVTINGIRVLVSIYSKSRIFMWVFICSLILLSLPELSHPVEILPIVGSCVGTWALFSKQGVEMRVLILFNSCCWVVHNIWAGSIGGSLVEATFIITNLVTIYKMVVQNKQEVRD